MKTFYILLFILAFKTTVYSQTIKYVTPTGAGDKNGTSWANASNNLQAMLDLADGSELQIWMAKGTYYASNGIELYASGTNTNLGTFTQDRKNTYKTFHLKRNVKLYGGFLGTESNITERPIESITNETILSGNNTQYHVLVAREIGNSVNNQITLDRLTITQGKTTSTANYDGNASQTHTRFGAGIYLVNSRLVLNNVKFTNNTAGNEGGAIYISSISNTQRAEIIATNCTFDNNKSTGTSALGSAIYIGDYSDVTLNTCTLSNNNTSTSPIYVHTSDTPNPASSRTTLKIENSNFNNNSSAKMGGAIKLGTYIKATINNTSFINNSTTDVATQTSTFVEEGGGALFANASTIYTELEIDKCIFDGNHTKSKGGAITIGSINQEHSFIRSSKFLNNTADVSGGAIDIQVRSRSNPNYNSNRPFKIENSLFYNNSAILRGGAQNIFASTEIYNINNTFYKNKVTTTTSVVNTTQDANARNGAGGAIQFIDDRYNNNSLTANIYNCLFADNEATANNFTNIYRSSSSNMSFAITNTLFANGTVSSNITGSTPNKVTLGSYTMSDIFKSTDDSSTDFLKLNPIATNIAINTGDDTKISSIITTDLSGVSRKNGTIDLGAYENHETLPVELTSFDINNKNNDVQLIWKVASETNNKEFLIERSSDGIKFDLIGIKKSLGNTPNLTTYNYIDPNPLHGTNYYKLSQIDLDGTTKVLAIKSFSGSITNNTLQIYPVPTKDFINIKFNNTSNSSTKISLITVSGKVVYSKSYPSNRESKTSIDLSDYPNGIYIIAVERPDFSERRIISINK